MIIVVEGQEGGGKSTLVNQLSDGLDWPVLKIKYGDGLKEHKTDEPEVIERLKALGVPVNTYVEDIIASIVLAELGTDAILDRALPSGIAYGAEFGEVDFGLAEQLLDIWADRLNFNCQIGSGPTTPMYVHVDVGYQTARRMCTHDEFRYTSAQFHAIGRRLRSIFLMRPVVDVFSRWWINSAGANHWPSKYATNIIEAIERCSIAPGDVMMLNERRS